MEKIESFLFAEKLEGNINSEINNNYHILLFNEGKQSPAVVYNQFILSKNHLYITIEGTYRPYAWKIFAGYRFEPQEKTRKHTGFRFDYSGDKLYDLAINIRDLVRDIENMHDRMWVGL